MDLLQANFLMDESSLTLEPAAKEMTDSQKQAMFQAVSNPLVLHKVIKSTKFSSLKICRQISRSWLSIANEAMVDRSQVKFMWDDRRLTFVKFHSSPPKSGQNGHYTMENLILSLWRNEFPSFPCNKIEFCGNVRNCLYRDDRVTLFFKIFGPKIKTLKLTQMGLVSKQKFFTNFNNHLPNLENLVFKNVTFYFQWQDCHDHRPCAQKFEMPALKNFDTADDTGRQSTVYRIVNGAPNLKNFTGFRLLRPELMALADSGRISIVKELHCTSLTSPEFLIKFVTAQKQAGRRGMLEKIEITAAVTTIDYSMAGPLSNLLEFNKDTLRELNLIQINSLGGTELPKTFSKLRSLHITSMHLLGAILMEKQSHGQQLFPRLRILDISSNNNLAGQIEVTWDVVLMNGILGTVDTLKIIGNLTETWMQRLHRLCPNFKNLTVFFQNPEQTGTVWSNIFRRWTHLVTLDLFSGQGPSGRHQVRDMDAIFSGIPPQVCRRLDPLAVQMDEVGFTNFFVGLRTGTPIANVRDLKRLTLHLKMLRDDLDTNVISVVSAIGGFKLLPNLDVNVLVTTDGLDERVRDVMTLNLGQYVDLRFDL